MENKKITDKPIFKKWWFWVIIAMIILGMIGSVTEDNSETPDVEDNNVTESLEDETFNEDFDSLCDKITSTYSSIGSVTCQDDTTWEINHEANSEAFPYEYRDINILGDDVSYEIKVIANPENTDYFREEYTCNAFYVGDGSCIVAEANDNILYSIILDENNQEEIISLSDELRAILEE